MAYPISKVLYSILKFGGFNSCPVFIPSAMKNSKIVVVQATPALFDLQKGLQLVDQWAQKAAQHSSDIIVFPEAFLPGYPRGYDFGTKVGDRSESGRDTWLTYWVNSISLDGKEIKVLGEIAKKVNSWIVIGVVERGPSGSLYCTLLYFNASGELVHSHRKLKPTAAERVIWAEGDGADLQTLHTDFGIIGGLICWENYMPLARTYLYQQGVQIYLAPTADQRDGWQHTLKHIALEGRCFVIGCNQYVTKADYPEMPGEDISHLPDIPCRGGSTIIDPLGNTIAEPLWDQEGFLIADLDLADIPRAKLDFDPVGHYARDDVFRLEKLR